MATLAGRNRLTVSKIKDFGVFLQADQFGEVLLPKREVDDNLEVGDEIDVTLYLDSEDRVIASKATPLCLMGEVALLQVVSTSPVGAFLDWGLPKDLLLPFAEQQRKVRTGDNVLVKVYIDNSGRIAASSKLNRHLDKQPPRYKENQGVNIVVAEQTDLGTKVVVNGRHWGMIFKEDQYKPMRYGQQLKAYIKQVRADGKISLFQNAPGKAPIAALHQRILKQLQDNQGYSPLADQSDADAIARTYGVSKRKYKMAIGKLKSDGKIRIDADGIRLL